MSEKTFLCCIALQCTIIEQLLDNGEKSLINFDFKKTKLPLFQENMFSYA